MRRHGARNQIGLGGKTFGAFGETVGAVTDTTAPTIGVLSVPTAFSSSRIDLSWTAAADAVGVTGYEITRSLSSVFTSPVIITTGNVLAYIDTGLAADTTYFYKHRARDAAGNYSAYSNSPSATTQSPPDTTAPTVTITAPAAGATLSGATNPFTATATDNIAVRGIKFYLDNVQIGVEDTTSPYSVNIDATTLASGTHTLKAVAHDTANNASVEATRSVTVGVTAAAYPIAVKIRVCPRAGGGGIEARMNGMVVQGSDTITGPWTALATIATPAPNPAYTDTAFTNSSRFKYLRLFAAAYVAGFDSGDVAEVIFLAANDVAIARVGVFGAGEYSAAYDAAKAFDGNTSTAFATGGGVDAYVGIEVLGS